MKIYMKDSAAIALGQLSRESASKMWQNVAKCGNVFSLKTNMTKCVEFVALLFC